MNEEHNLEGQSSLNPPAVMAAGVHEVMTLTPDLVRPLEAVPPQEVPPGGASPIGVHSAVPAGSTGTAAADDQATPLFSIDEAKGFRARWDAIQGAFVDEPHRAVEQADTLVADAMTRLAEVFKDERAKLEGQWARDESVSTEDLRLALRRYRSFFGRLLSV